jgi:hypothetical protein
MTTYSGTLDISRSLQLVGWAKAYCSHLAPTYASRTRGRAYRPAAMVGTAAVAAEPAIGLAKGETRWPRPARLSPKRPQRPSQ